MTGYDVETTIHELLANPDARDTLERYLPGIADNEWVRTSPGMRLSFMLNFAATLGGEGRATLADELAAIERTPYGPAPEEPWPGPRDDYEDAGVAPASAPAMGPTEGMDADSATAYRTVVDSAAESSRENGAVENPAS